MHTDNFDTEMLEWRAMKPICRARANEVSWKIVEEMYLLERKRRRERWRWRVFCFEWGPRMVKPGMSRYARTASWAKRFRITPKGFIPPFISETVAVLVAWHQGSICSDREWMRISDRLSSNDSQTFAIQNRFALEFEPSWIMSLHGLQTLLARAAKCLSFLEKQSVQDSETIRFS